MRFSSTARLAPALAPLSLLISAACAVGPKYHGPPAVPMSAGWVEPVATGSVEDAWWRSLGDPTLDDLVQSAMAHNADVRVATAQLAEARANRSAAAAARWPQVDISGSATRNEVSGNGEIPIAHIPGFNRRYGLFDAGFDASWELDLWGRIAKGVEAADARAASAQEARRNTLIQVEAEVVRAYVDLRSAQTRLASATSDADARAATAVLVAQRLRTGEASRSDLAQAESQSLTATSQLAGLRADARAAAYSLALLTGRPPETLIALAERAGPLPNPPQGVGAGLRSELLRRRPDVRAAERDLAAATADQAVAVADLFPRVTLAAAVGQQATHPGDLGSALSTRYQLGPSLSWPVFDAGRLRAEVRAAGARADAASARYEKAVLTALSDSETAINRYAAASSQRRDRDAAMAKSAETLALARQRYQAGEDDLLTVFDTQSAFTTAEQSALEAKAAELTAFAALQKALGAGWVDDHPPARS
jgi:NodT family efflux transporter outer membrane factor (OMF) lipoprotein